MLWYYVLVDKLYRENSTKLGTGVILKPTFEKVQRERDLGLTCLLQRHVHLNITWPVLRQLFLKSMNFLNKLLNMNF